MHCCAQRGVLTIIAWATKKKALSMPSMRKVSPKQPSSSLWNGQLRVRFAHLIYPLGFHWQLRFYLFMDSPKCRAPTPRSSPSEIGAQTHASIWHQNNPSPNLDFIHLQRRS